MSGSHGTASSTPVANEDIWFRADPGEARFCGGCHENRLATTPLTPGVQASVLSGVVNLDVPREMRKSLPAATLDGSGKLPPANVARRRRRARRTVGPGHPADPHRKCATCHDGDATKSYNPSYTVTDMTTGTSQTFVFDLRGQKLTVTVGEKMTGDYTASYLSLLGLGDILGDDVVSITGTPPNYVVPAAAEASPLMMLLNPPQRFPADPTVRAFGSAPFSMKVGGTPMTFPGTPHPVDVGGTELTPDEYYLLILNIDMGGQFYFRENFRNRGPRTCGAITCETSSCGTRPSSRRRVAGAGGGCSGRARAGHGGSPAAIQQAIAANSVDAIQAELERAEHLVCAACADLVMPLVDHPDARVRRVAAWWLARRRRPRSVQVAMLNRLSQPDSTAARNVADVLGELRTPTCRRWAPRCRTRSSRARRAPPWRRRWGPSGGPPARRI